MLAGLRILVADDDDDLLEAIAQVLEHEGAVVVRADSGVALIEHLANDGPFALVITDISMPWMSGLQVMQSSRFAGLRTPIIVMTALRDPRLHAQVGALGPDAVLLTKPFDLDQLKAVASGLLSAGPPGTSPHP